MTRETVEFSCDLELDFAKYAITVPFPGSKLLMTDGNKDLFRDDWENYTTFNPDPDRLVYHPHGYDPKQLIEMQAWALRRVLFASRTDQKAVFRTAYNQS